MSDQDGGVWFRRRTRRLGYSFVPVTWQGWVMILGFAPVLLATVFAGDPSLAKPSSTPLFLKAKALLGLSGAHLPPLTVAALIVGEVLVFLILLLRMSRPLRSLD